MHETTFLYDSIYINENASAGSYTADNYKGMLPNNDNKAIIESMNNASILEINIIFFVESFGGGREQVLTMRVQNSLNGPYMYMHRYKPFKILVPIY